jgi:hypothetical protein
MTSVAIHQPNFLPWLGYFDKIRRADVFVVLDTAQYSRGSWTNRVKMLVSGGPSWVTVPIVRAHGGFQSISDTQIDNHTPWREKVLKTIELNYRKAPHFDAVFPWLSELIHSPISGIGAYNLSAIRAIMSALHLDLEKLRLASGLGADGTATTLLASLVRAAGGDTYLAGGGASEYQDDAIFSESGVQVRYQAFSHPTYRQLNSSEFVAGLSVVDALMNCGFDGTADLLERARALHS